MRIRSVAIDNCLGVIASYTFHGLSCQDKLCHTSSQLALLCHKESYSVTRSGATLVIGLPFGSFATKERRLSLSSPSPSLARFTIFWRPEWPEPFRSSLSHKPIITPYTALVYLRARVQIVAHLFDGHPGSPSLWKSKLAQARKNWRDLVGPREFRNPSSEHPWPTFLPHPGSRLFQVAFVILR